MRHRISHDMSEFVADRLRYEMPIEFQLVWITCRKSPFATHCDSRSSFVPEGSGLHGTWRRQALKDLRWKPHAVWKCSTKFDSCCTPGRSPYQLSDEVGRKKSQGSVSSEADRRFKDWGEKVSDRWHDVREIQDLHEFQGILVSFYNCVRA